MQWAACQGRRQFTGEGPAKSCIHSQFTPISALFKVSNFSLFFLYFLHYYWLLPEQLFPSLLQNYHAHTDRQAADGGTRCVHEEIQFGNETNVLRRGGDVAAPQEEEEEEEEEEEVQSGTGSAPGPGMGIRRQRRILPVFTHLFMYLFAYLFIYLFGSRDAALAADSKHGSSPQNNKKAQRQQDTVLMFEGKYWGGGGGGVGQKNKNILILYYDGLLQQSETIPFN